MNPSSGDLMGSAPDLRGTIVLLGEERFEYRERSGYAAAFRRLGWDVRWWPHEDAGLTRFLERCERALVVHPDDIGAPVPIDIARLPVPTVLFHFDTFTYPEVRIRRSLLFDVVCCFHPGWPERFERAGHPGAMLVPHAIDDARYTELGTSAPIWDVGWVGRLDGPLYESRRRVLPLLAARFAMNDWTATTPMERVGDVYARSRVVVNIPRDDWPRDANLRAFEAMGAGALLITPMPSELTDLGLVEGRHFVGYRSEDELMDVVERTLHDGSALGGIARAGRGRVLADHTYVKRAQSILRKAFGQNRPVAPARRWPTSAVAQVILEQYVQERRWGSIAGPARGLVRTAGWRTAAAAWYLATRYWPKATGGGPAR
jgi:hypothetical protein